MSKYEAITSRPWLVALCVILAVACLCLIVAVVLLSKQIGDIDREASMTDIGDVGRSESWEVEHRLPRDTLPLHYDLLLHPDLHKGTFSGEVTILLETKSPRSFLLANTKNLEIPVTYLLDSGGKAVALKDSFESKKNEFWVVQPQNILSPGNYSLHMKFSGKLTDAIVGFYRSTYVNPETGKKRSIATSKFQPTYARRAFPCFDEPSFKSTFSVSLVRPSNDGYIALSNMNENGAEANKPSQGLTTVKFSTSVPMVTYLACFIVCDFDYKDSVVPTQKIPFRVFSTPNQVEQTNYALETGVSITEYYINYFEIDYPLPKLDMIAIPDFVSGAMEHWGLITYRETNLLFDSEESSAANKQRVAVVIGHELAHMWFGNLVTLAWWDDLWLNEGFASYMEYKGVNSCHPDWGMMDQFLTEDLHSVLQLDAVLSSHPIVQAVGHPDQITELFDTISYNKGASVIRMLENFMGEDVFENGIHNFLDKYKFKNAVTQNLWDELQSVLSSKEFSINISQVMDTWTRQMGFPVVTVTKNDDSYILRQSRFLADPDGKYDDSESPYRYKWQIPLTYRTDQSSEPKLAWINMNEDKLVLPRPAGAKWIKFNHHQVGYYRVNYDPEDWKSLQDVVTTLDIADRAHLLDDAFSLADARQLDYSVALDMTRYLKGEESYVSWSTASGKLEKLEVLLRGSDTHAGLQQYVKRLVKPLYDKLGWVDEGSHLLRRLRVTVIDLACGFGDAGCLSKAGDLFTEWLETGKKLPVNLRSLVYQYGMNSIGGQSEWDEVWKKYKNEVNAQERSKLLLGLSWVKKADLLTGFIEKSKSEENVRSQDFFTVLQYIASNPVGTPLVWNFVREEWKYLTDRFSLNNRYLGQLIPQVTATFSTAERLTEMEDFFAQYPQAGAGETARKQAREKLKNNIQWVKTHKETLKTWLEKEEKS